MRPNMRSPPPYSVRPSETDPLIPYHFSSSQRHSGSFYRQILTVLLTAVATAAIFAVVFPLSSCNDPLDLDVRDRIHREWELERRHHQEEVSKRIDIEHRWQVEDDERDHRREQWLQEAEEHERNLSEAIRRENQEKEARRAEWEREVERHDRDASERRERERRERLRLNMFWTDPESHLCTTYGTREYTARLVNIPENYNHRIEACMDTPIKIHGVEYKAKRCEDHGSGNVVGHWHIDQHEPDCASYWNGYKDLGCGSPRSGQRRIEHHLENLPEEGDWKEFCATTPASFHGMHFMGAQFCSKTVCCSVTLYLVQFIDWFQILGAVYGHWVFDDESCN